MKREVVLVVALVFLCTIIFSFSTHSVSASECNDHVDNNENGYCDAPVQGAYCEDGSIVGDPTCTTTQSSESAACLASEEVCDGVDNDCDGQIDDGLFQTMECGSNIGECSYGVQSRECRGGVYSGWSACTGSVDPARETCDGLDNDCNNVVDDDCPTSQVVTNTDSHQASQNQVTSNTSSSSNEQDNLTNNQDRTEVEITEKIAEKDNFTIIIFIIVGILVLIYIIVEIIFAFQRKKV